MKTLAVGAGSMGRRRLRDLTHLLGSDVVLFEPNAQRCQEVAAAFGVRGVTDFDEGLAEKPEIISISTPPALHEPYVRAALDRGMHIFAEVPFVFDLKAMNEVAERAVDYSAVLGISCSSRYYPPFRLIHDLLAQQSIGKPLYFEYSLGNYLPDWHPYEDYRKFYAGDMRQGGAGMDMLLHEMNIIQWWLGSVETVQARLSKVSSLEINGPDNHDVLLKFSSGCRGFFHHDVLERGTLGRHLRVVGDEGTLEWHQNQDSVRLYDGQQNQATQINFDQAADWDAATDASREVSELLARQTAQSGKIPSGTASKFVYESCYLREMRHFLNAVSGREKYRMSTPGEELRTVRTFHAILQSSDQNRELKVDDVR